MSKHNMPYKELNLNLVTDKVVTVSKTKLSQCGDNIMTSLPLCGNKVVATLYNLDF